jgi:hypothetical protein
MILPLISAVEFDIKEEFKQGETLMARVSGNFIEPVLKENILFFKGHVRVSIDAYVAKINEEFYIYAKLPETENNYSIKIENVEYMQGSKQIDDDLEMNFTILNSTADFSLTPGFVITEEDFSLQVQNLQDKKITIDVETTPVSGNGGFASSIFGSEDTEVADGGSFELRSGEIKDIDFNVEQAEESTIKMIKLKSENIEYEVPIFIFESGKEPEKEEFNLDPGDLQIQIPTNVARTRTIYLENNGDVKLENITLELSDSLFPYISLESDFIDEIESNEEVQIVLEIISGPLEEIVEGQLTARIRDEKYTYTSIELEIISDFIPIDIVEPIDSGFASTKTCMELGGNVCVDNETCTDAEPTYAKDDVCCMNSCEEIQEGSSRLIGWLLVIIVIGAVAWFFFKRYKKV